MPGSASLASIGDITKWGMSFKDATRPYWWMRRIRPRRPGGNLKEIPRGQRYSGRPDIQALFAKAKSLTKRQRDRLIRRAHREHGYTLAAIGNALELQYSTVSKVVNRENDISRPDPISL